MNDASSSRREDAGLIKDCAAEWLQRREFWNWTSEDQGALDAWLAESPAHEVAFIRMERTWARTERLAALRKSDVGAKRSTEWIRQTSTRVALGVAVLILLGTVSFVYLSGTSGRIYSTPMGATRVILLADGSRIQLNTDSVLRLNAQSRSAVLERGEAYFEIQHNAAAPFTVIAANHRVTDIGTKFSVRTNAGKIEVSLIGGKARIDDMRPSGDMRMAMLAPGDVAVATQGGLSVTHKSVQYLLDSLAWRRGILIFDDITLAEAVGELSRYSPRKIVIADSAVARRTIYGSIPTNDVDAFIRVARNVMGLHVQSMGDEVVISR